jgi:Protein of unknown function (DUF3761)
MKPKPILASGLLALAMALGGVASAQTVTCTDGTTARAGRGACSHHGGVAFGKTTAQAKSAASDLKAESRSTLKKGEQAAEKAGVTVRCKDGASSVAGRGACSHHGGIAQTTAPATPAPTANPAAPAAERGQPAVPPGAGNATAKCKDGTYSYSKRHSGACSHHGGVAEWMDTLK